MITFKEYLLEADAKSREAKDFERKKKDKPKHFVKSKKVGKRQSGAGVTYIHHNRTPEMLKRQSGL